VNIHEFYEADPRRRDSDEREYGDGWTEQRDPHATYRISRIIDTGEVYAVREPHPGGILARYLDELRIDQADVNELTVEILGTFTEDGIDDALAGWQRAMGRHNSLDWARARLAPA
jgi:hypothetical protein